MAENVIRNMRLKKFEREQIRKTLLNIGRKLVVTKGSDFLTARKLSEAANTSVGTIYNTFATMDEFVAAENKQTLQELYDALALVIPERNPYNTINRYADVFGSFVINNRNLWMLLYREHLFNAGRPLNAAYKKLLCKFEKLLEEQVRAMVGCLSKTERRISMQVLGMAVFALSGFLTADKEAKIRRINKENLCKVLINTYLAGLNSLKRVCR
ncbi:MAG: TetR/AcrR family transcriptional regulator [Alphaproteobacteria bacterium]|nr:TetR/AcrR family transcriptional regulator [Alphaproteobacteria bacterium]